MKKILLTAFFVFVTALPLSVLAQSNAVSEVVISKTLDAGNTKVDESSKVQANKCEINGKPVDCDLLLDTFVEGPLPKVIFILAALIFVIVAVSIVFTLIMLVVCVTDKHNKHKPLWILVFLLFGPLAGLVYIFVRNKEPRTLLDPNSIDSGSAVSK